MKQQQSFLSGLKPLGHCTTVLLAERIVLSSATTCAMLQQCRAGVPLFIFLFAPFHLSRCAGGGEEEERGRAGPSRKRERERETPIHLHISLTSPFQPSRRGIAGYHPGIGFDVGSDSRFTVHHFTRALRALCTYLVFLVRGFVRFAISLACSF